MKVFFFQGTWKQQLRMKFRNMQRPSAASESVSAQEGRRQSAEECTTSMHNDGEKEQGLISFYSSSCVG